MISLAIVLAVALIAYLASETRMEEGQPPTIAASEVPISTPSREKEKVNSRLTIHEGGEIRVRSFAGILRCCG